MSVAALDDADETSVVRFSPVAGDERALVTVRRAPDGMARPAIWHVRSGELNFVKVPDRRPTTEFVGLEWSADATQILICSAQKTTQQLHRCDASGGEWSTARLPPGSVWWVDLNEPTFLPDGSVLVILTSGAEPGTVYRWDPDTPIRDDHEATSTHVTRALGLPTTPGPSGRPLRSVTMAVGESGIDVQGWLAVPPGPGPFPTILYLHGGPHWEAVNRFDSAAQAWVADGFAHLSLNYRGSTGRGTAFARQIWPGGGELPLQDMAAARDFLVRTAVAWPDQIVLTGESFGGYLSLLGLVRQPTLWAAALPQVPIADWAETYRASHPVMQRAFRNWFGGSPHDVPARYRRASPIEYVDELQVPVLAWHGTHDSRTPPGQLRAFADAVNQRGGVMEVIWYTGGHDGPGHAETVDYHLRAHDFVHRVLAGASGASRRPRS